MKSMVQQCSVASCHGVHWLCLNHMLPLSAICYFCLPSAKYPLISSRKGQWWYVKVASVCAYIAQTPMMVIEGNHEIERDAANRTFQAYFNRFRVPHAESGSPSPHFYSFDLAGACAIWQVHACGVGGDASYVSHHMHCWSNMPVDRSPAFSAGIGQPGLPDPKGEPAIFPACDDLLQTVVCAALAHPCLMLIAWVGCSGAHFLMLGAYTHFNQSSAQYKWLKADLAAFSRARTPWLIATFHATWYNTYEVSRLASPSC